MAATGASGNRDRQAALEAADRESIVRWPDPSPLDAWWAEVMAGCTPP